MSQEFYDAQEHQLNKALLETIRRTVGEWIATHPETGADELADTLGRAGFEVPVLYCQGYTKADDPCGLRLYHEGECSFR